LLSGFVGNYPYFSSTRYVNYWDMGGTFRGTSKSGYFGFDISSSLEFLQGVLFEKQLLPWFQTGPRLSQSTGYWSLYASNDFSSWALLDTASNARGNEQET
jgi:hypothetical protein